jgi:hypothetical protein
VADNRGVNNLACISRAARRGAVAVPARGPHPGLAPLFYVPGPAPPINAGPPIKQRRVRFHWCKTFWVQVELWTTFYVIDRWKRSVDSVHESKARAAMSGSKKLAFLQDWPPPRADQKRQKQTMRKSPQERTELTTISRLDQPSGSQSVAAGPT